MRPIDLEQLIMLHIRNNSGFETKRPYLGMSHLSDCPRKQYLDFMHGMAPNDIRHLGAFSGYTFEHIELNLLVQIGIIKPLLRRELVASFDPLLRGHIDAETKDGDLVEIKSVSTRKFDLVCKTNRPLREHFEQVQAYMHFGNYRQTFIVYVCRETFQHKVFQIFYNPDVSKELEVKARLILASILSRKPPVCICGKCSIPDSVREEEK